jgi:hypothetical protein
MKAKKSISRDEKGNVTLKLKMKFKTPKNLKSKFKKGKDSLASQVAGLASMAKNIDVEDLASQVKDQLTDLANGAETKIVDLYKSTFGKESEKESEVKSTDEKGKKSKKKNKKSSSDATVTEIKSDK